MGIDFVGNRWGIHWNNAARVKQGVDPPTDFPPNVICVEGIGGGIQGL